VPSDRLPTPAPTKLAANGPVGPGGKRTVVKGETLYSVAKNENVSIPALAKANGLSLNAMLKAGQVLTIPSASAPSAAPKAAAPKAAAPKAAPAPAPTFAPLKLVPAHRHRARPGRRSGQEVSRRAVDTPWSSRSSRRSRAPWVGTPSASSCSR
jgi:murein DD-endopeptidase MepM/ murein hydrolase activator NlpD